MFGAGAIVALAGLLPAAAAADPSREAPAVAAAQASGNADFVGAWTSTAGDFDIQTENLATGACTGTTEFSGGTLTGCQVTGDAYAFTINLGASYHSYNSGTINGNSVTGSFRDTNGTTESYTAARAFTGDPTTTAVTCGGSGPLACTVTVIGDAVNGAPTGQVSFAATAGSSPAGSFPSGASCALGGIVGSDSSQCAVSYAPPAQGSGTASVTVAASYGGDPDYAPSLGSVTLCSDGESVGLDSVAWVGRHDNGFEIGAQAVLHGCGLAAGDTVTWGNSDAEDTLSTADITQSGAQATVVVPWEATTGDVTVSDGAHTATLADQPVDSWRNTQGFGFHNFQDATSTQQIVDAFTNNLTGGATFPSGAPKLLPQYSRLYSSTARLVGRCFGFAYLSAAMADGSVAVARFGPAATPFGLTQTPDLTNAIDVDWWKQFADERAGYLRNSTLNRDGSDLRSQLEAVFGANGYYSPALVSVRWTVHGTLESHALVAYAVRDTPTDTDPGAFTIYTYDSNNQFNPVEDSDAAQHVGAQGASNIDVDSTGHWTLTLERAQGGPGQMTIVPFSAIAGPLHLGVLPTTLISDQTVVESVDDPATGKPVDIYSGGSGGVVLEADEDGAVPGSAPASAASGSGLAGVDTILGPAGTWRETLAGSAAGVGATWSGSTASAALQAGAGTDATSFNTRTGALSLAPAAGQSPSRHGTAQLIDDAGSTERVLTITGPVVTSHLTASFRGGAARISTATAGLFDLELSIAGRGVTWTTSDLGMTSLGAGQTLTLDRATGAGSRACRSAAR